MNSRQRTLAAITGEPHDRVPVAQHNFMFCIRHTGISMHDFRYKPKEAAKAFVNTAYDFGYDCIILDFDTCVLAEAMGSKLEYPADEPARVKDYFLQSIRDVDKLKIPDPYKDGRLPLWLETTREVRSLVGDDLAVMGRGDQGPFGLLFLLRQSDQFMMDLLSEDDKYIFQGLETCMEAGVRFAKAQLEAGADLTSVGDGASGESLISPEYYMKFSQPFEKRYKEELGEGLIALHICGKSNRIIEGMIDTGFDCLEVDHQNDIEQTLRVAANRTSIWGNLDPSRMLAFGSREQVFVESRRVIDIAKKLTWKFVLCPGCLVQSNTPPENIQAMTDAAVEFGAYEEEPEFGSS